MDLREGGADTRKLSILQQQEESQSASAIEENIPKVITSKIVRDLL
jgi:hypothetical protein